MMNRRNEIERNERVARRAQENLMKAALPPRMEKHEKEKAVKKLMNENIQEVEYPKEKFVAKEVPEFEKIHKQLGDLLERKKKNKRPTEVSEFNFQEVDHHKGVARTYLGHEDRNEAKEDPIEVARRVTEAKPKIQPQTTKKMIALSEQRKREREENRRKIEQIEKEDEERKSRYQKVPSSFLE